MSTQPSDSEAATAVDNSSQEQTESHVDAEEKAEVKNPSPGLASKAPDGGLVAWLVVLGAWCTSFCSFGWLNSIGVFQDYYESGPLRNFSSSAIAWIPSLQIFFMFAMGPVVGGLFDKYGPRYLIIGGAFLHVFGLMMASISTQYYQFLLSQGVCSAIGVAAIFQPALSCIMGWFDKNRGSAYGVMATGSSLGGIIFPIMLNRLIKAIGYGWAMRASAFLILGLLLIAIATVKVRTVHNKPPLSRAQMAKPFKELPFIALAIGLGLATAGIWVPIDYIPVEGTAIGGISSFLSQYIVSIFNAASLFGRLSAGVAADKVGKYNIFGVCCYISGILTLALWIPGIGKGATIAYAVLYGLFSGAYVSLIGGLVAQISVPQEIGYRTGLIFLASAVPGLATNPIAGAILTNTGSWTSVKVFSGVLIIVGTTLVLYTRVAKVGWKLTTVF